MSLFLISSSVLANSDCDQIKDTFAQYDCRNNQIKQRAKNLVEKQKQEEYQRQQFEAQKKQLELERLKQRNQNLSASKKEDKEFNAQEYFDKQNKTYQNNAIKGGGPSEIKYKNNLGMVNCNKINDAKACPK